MNRYKWPKDNEKKKYIFGISVSFKLSKNSEIHLLNGTV